MSIETLLKEVDEVLMKHELPERHSFFQIEKFMIGKEPTAQAQLWQIIREMQVRIESIDVYRSELEDAEDNLELFDIKIDRLSSHIRKQATCPDDQDDVREAEIEIRKIQRAKKNLVRASQKVRKKLINVLEELEFLKTGYDRIVAEHGEPKPFDDPDAQRELWNEKLLEEFNLRMILKRPLDPEFIKTALCLGDAPVARHVTSLIDNIQRQMMAERPRPQVEVKPKTIGG